MSEALTLFLAIEIVGVLALPITSSFLPDTPAAPAFGKPIGLLVAVFPAWLLAETHVVGYGLPTIWLGIAILVAISTASIVADWRLAKPRIVYWLAAEAVFVVTFLIALLVRGFAPDVWGTEKPMNMAFINAINRAHDFPPVDPWLSGAKLNYYYFGHFTVAWLMRLTGAEATRGYNVGFAIIFGVSAVAVFGTAAALALIVRRRTMSVRRVLAAGGLATVLAMLAGTLATAPELWRSRHALVAFRWWEPSRVIPNTANDFPFYSILLGDLHAHVLVVPFSLLLTVFSIQIAVYGPRLPASRSLTGLAASAAQISIAVLALAAVAATNTFSVPAAVVLVVGGAFIWAASTQSYGSAVAWLGAWLIGAAIVVAPFLSSFDPQPGGFGLVDVHTSFGAFLLNETYLYGAFILALSPVFIRQVRGLFPRPHLLIYAGVLLVAAVALAIPFGGAVPVVAAFAVALSWYGVVEKGGLPRHRILWLIIAVGVSVALVGEFVYLKDVFASGADFRFNTVFKFGYQAWYLLAIAAAVSLVTVSATGRAARVGLGGAITVLAIALVYPVVGSYSQSGGYKHVPKLYGLRWLESRSADDVSAIRWLQENVDGQPTIVEAIGDDFAARGNGRVSTFTGLPAVVGWFGHEVQWNHKIGTRWDDVQEIYRTTDVATAECLLDRYGVRFIFVGSLEQEDYPAEGLAKFSRIAKLVYQHGATKIFATRARRSAEQPHLACKSRPSARPDVPTVPPRR